VLYGVWPGAVTALVSALWFGFFWYAIPSRLAGPVRELEGRGQPGNDDPPAGPG